MRGVNKVILVGNLGHDVEVRQMTNGNAVANIRIATNERWTRRDTGQVQEHTEWHNVVLFGRRAELAQQYLRKGSRIYVEGRLRTRSWQDREGNERRSTEVVADDMQFLDRRSDGDFDQRRGGGGGSNTGQRGGGSYGKNNKFEDSGMDDEVPF